MEKQNNRANDLVRLSALIFVSAVAIIALTLIPVLLKTEFLNTLCLCKVNYIAWSWICFASSAVLSLMLFIARIVPAKSEKVSYQITVLSAFMFVLQAAIFVAGLMFLIVFACKLLKLM
ncbi:MAG: hypothetical protein KJ607_00660 [Bacteroidetes bacterium]|nr:hypothetical protein [Bacteroidota bacterium]